MMQHIMELHILMLVAIKCTKCISKKIVSFNGTNEVPLDLLTVSGTHYITISNNYPVVTFSQALCELKPKHIILSYQHLMIYVVKSIYFDIFN